MAYLILNAKNARFIGGWAEPEPLVKLTTFFGKVRVVAATLLPCVTKTENNGGDGFLAVAGLLGLGLEPTSPV